MALLRHPSREVDRTTLAEIHAAPTSTTLDYVVVDRITEFSYSYDVLQMADPFTVTVPDPAGKFRDKLLPGWSVRFYMRNPAVAGGALTLKVNGLVTGREASSDASGGTVIRVSGADLGWHLHNNDAPLWFNLRGASLERLAEACVHPEKVFPKDTDPGWGFKEEILHDNARNRSIKRKLPFTAAENLALRQAQEAGGTVWTQVQPGQKIADLLIQYARRLGLLVGVSVEGNLQFFLPDYAQEAAYSIAYPRSEQGRQRSNVISATRSDSLDPVYTHVTVVGESPIHQSVAGPVTTFVPQFATIYGRATTADWPSGATPPPFRRRAYISDGEITQKPKRRAMWHQRRGLFDAQTLTYVVRGHHQGGAWWEADTMCEVRDEVLGVQGERYVSRVRCTRTEQDGDRTEVTLKRPDLLDEVPLRL